VYDNRSKACSREGTWRACLSLTPSKSIGSWSLRSTFRRVGVVVATGALLTLMGCSSALHDSSSSPRAPKGRESSSLPMSLPAVETLYSADMVARINAERAARSTAQVPLPQLQVDPGLEASAQAWSTYIASVSYTHLPPTAPIAVVRTELAHPGQHLVGIEPMSWQATVSGSVGHGRSSPR